MEPSVVIIKKEKEEEKNCKTHYIGAKWYKFLHVGGIWAYFPTFLLAFF